MKLSPVEILAAGLGGLLGTFALVELGRVLERRSSMRAALELFNGPLWTAIGEFISRYGQEWRPTAYPTRIVDVDYDPQGRQLAQMATLDGEDVLVLNAAIYELLRPAAIAVGRTPDGWIALSVADLAARKELVRQASDIKEQIIGSLPQPDRTSVALRWKHLANEFGLPPIQIHHLEDAILRLGSSHLSTNDLDAKTSPDNRD